MFKYQKLLGKVPIVILTRVNICKKVIHLFIQFLNGVFYIIQSSITIMLKQCERMLLKQHPNH